MHMRIYVYQTPYADCFLVQPGHRLLEQVCTELCLANADENGIIVEI